MKVLPRKWHLKLNQKNEKLISQERIVGSGRVAGVIRGKGISKPRLGWGNLAQSHPPPGVGT